MKNKKALCFLLAASMALSLVTGCSGSPASDGSSVASGSSTGGGDTNEEVKLIWNLIGTPQSDQDTVFEEVNKVLKEELNTTVQFNLIDWGSYDQKMKMAISTNEAFDMCYTADWSNAYAPNAQKGAFAELDDLLQKYGKNILEQVPESYWDAVKIGGKIYGVINYQITARIPGCSFPKDVVDEIGYDVSKIHKYADLEDYFKVIQEKRPDLTPFLSMDKTTMPVLLTEETGYFMDYLSGPLAVLEKDPTKSINAVELPEFMDFCKMMQDWYEKGYVRKDVASITDTQAEAKTHEYAAFLTGTGPGSAQVESGVAGFEVVQAQVIPSNLSTGSIQAALTSISKNSQHPDRAMMVLDYLFKDKETYNTLSYGIKGKHYNEMEDGSMELIADSGYNPGVPWAMGSWFNAKLLKGQPEDLWEQQKEINETAIQSPVLGFVYDSTNVKTEFAQITNLMSEYLPGLVTGTVDPEEKIPELIEKMNAAGMGKIMEDADKQLAEWKSSK